MSAYLPGDYVVVGWMLAALLGTLAVGFGVTRIPHLRVARIGAWLLVFSAVIGTERLLKLQPAGFRMLAIILVLLYAMKAVVSVEAHAAGEPRLTPLRWLSFAAAWFGMRPAIFAALGGPPIVGAGALRWLGVKRMGAGIAFVALAWLAWTQSVQRLDGISSLSALRGVLRVVVTALLLVGLSLILHFGVFSIIAGVWRSLGVNCNLLFRAPLKSTSLSEFWGRRWNRAFSEMTAVGVYRPLAQVTGQRLAIIATFLFSGLLHEVAISVPVRAGFGLPMLYFAIHGTLVLIERRLERSGRPISRIKWVGRAWTIFWLVLPLPILFHPPFLKGVIWPLIGA